jgi:hypothetical protein
VHFFFAGFPHEILSTSSNVGRQQSISGFGKASFQITGSKHSGGSLLASTLGPFIAAVSVDAPHFVVFAPKFGNGRLLQRLWGP